MKKILLIIPVLIACSSPKTPPNKEASDYRPAVLPQALPIQNTEPGSAQSPAVQQLPQASP